MEGTELKKPLGYLLAGCAGNVNGDVTDPVPVLICGCWKYGNKLHNK